jgi:hypothetical protein
MGLVYGSGPYGDGPYGGGSPPATEFTRFDSSLVVLIEITLPNAQKVYLSNLGARFWGKPYAGSLLQIGTIRRVLQKTLGIFEATAVEFEVSDTQQIYSSLPLPIKGASAIVRVGSKRMSLGAYQVVAKGKIDNYYMAEFTMSFVLKDALFDMPEFPDVGDVNETDFPNAWEGEKGRPLPLVYGTHSVTTAEDARDRGAWPVIYIDNTSDAKKLLIARHHVKAINEVYASKPSAGSALLTNVTDYTAVPNGVIGGMNCAYIQMTNAQFNSKMLENGSLAVMTVNVQGRMDGVDGLVINPIDALKDVLKNFCGDPEIDNDAFDEARSVAAGRSYIVRGGYSDKLTTAEMLQQFCRSFNIRLYVKVGGKVSVDIFAPAPLGSAVTTFDQNRDILQGSWRIDHDASIEGAQDSQVINRVNYQSDFHYAKKKFFASDVIDDADSQVDYGVKNFTLDATWAGQDTAFDVGQRLILQFRDPQAHATFKTHLRGLLVELADQVKVNHDNGHLGVPWVGENLEVLTHSFNPNNGEVEIRGINVTELTANGFWLDDEDARVLADTGTAGVSNGSGTINITSGPASLITAGVQVGDVIRLKSGVNKSHHKVTAVAATSVDVANTVWTNETGITYEILPSWLTATAAQKVYGHLCDEATGLFSNGDQPPVLL